ncbi:MAG: hypothetical protein J3K34DRAFT_418779 [Monoraphidium minutum]|nr:MAG: hypothetical protein J3K34DRAFT_418779 [Monoraphidium minutum]
MYETSTPPLLFAPAPCAAWASAGAGLPRGGGAAAAPHYYARPFRRSPAPQPPALAKRPLCWRRGAAPRLGARALPRRHGVAPSRAAAISLTARKLFPKNLSAPHCSNVSGRTPGCPRSSLGAAARAFPAPSRAAARTRHPNTRGTVLIGPMPAEEQAPSPAAARLGQRWLPMHVCLATDVCPLTESTAAGAPAPNRGSPAGPFWWRRLLPREGRGGRAAAAGGPGSVGGPASGRAPPPPSPRLCIFCPWLPSYPLSVRARPSRRCPAPLVPRAQAARERARRRRCFAPRLPSSFRQLLH